MIKPNIRSEGFLKSYLVNIIRPSWLAIIAIAGLYSLIFWSVNKGVSIDEGYYLLGYLPDQRLAPNTTDFHRIVRSVFFFLPPDNVLLLRWARVVLNIGLLFFFLNKAHTWMNKRLNIGISKTLFLSLGLLSGTMCFAYATPVFYYDNLQLMLYLLVFTLFFLAEASPTKVIRITAYSLIGFVMVFGLTNYPPSGLILIAIILTIKPLIARSGFKNVLIHWLFITGGFVLGLFVYSLWIHNVVDFFREALWAYENSAKSARAKYNTDGQLLVLGRYLLGMLKVYLPLAAMALLYFLLIYGTRINRYIVNFAFGLLLIAATYKYSAYFSNILLLPVLLLLVDTIIQVYGKKTWPGMSRNLYLIMILLALPLLAVAGSNQRLEMKMVFFMPFWFLVYVLLLGEFKKYLNTTQVPVWHTVFILVFFVVFSTQGFLKHIHYNYSIKRSVHRIENAERFRNIGVSEYQCVFYENGIRKLKEAGFEPGDKVLTFFETFMLVYAAGGYVPHRLTYSAEFFMNNAENIPPNKPAFIIIDQNQVSPMTDFLAVTGWDFPDSYHMVELGTDGHNLTQLGYNYLLFFNKKPNTAPHIPNTQ